MAKTRRKTRATTRRTSPTADKKMERVITMLKSDTYATIRDVLLNLLLVHYGGRNAFLLESANYTNSEYKIEDLLRILSETSLHVVKDSTSLPDYPRYWVTKEKLKSKPETDEEIGQLLGMKNPGGEFYDYTKKRLSLRIKEKKTGATITTELLKGDIKDADNIAFSKQKAESFHVVMKSLGLPYTFTYHLEQDDGTKKRLHELKEENMDYLKEHLAEYKDDLVNALLEKEGTHPIIILFEKAVSTPHKLFRTYLPLFVSIFKMFNKDSYIDDKKQTKINKKFVEIIQSTLK